MDQVMISLKPEYAALVLSGAKTVELRNRKVRLKAGTAIWIYATQPEGRIVARAKVSTVFYGGPAEIWNRYGKEVCIKKKHFDYYTGRRRMVSALVLASVEKLEDSITLEAIRQVVQDFHPPQFYSYIPSGNRLFGTLNDSVTGPVSRRRR